MIRNKVIGESELGDPQILAKQVNNSYNKHKLAWEAAKVSKSQLVSWDAPPLGLVKVNFDAAVRTNVVTLAAGCRNHKAQILHI